MGHHKGQPTLTLRSRNFCQNIDKAVCPCHQKQEAQSYSSPLFITTWLERTVPPYISTFRHLKKNPDDTGECVTNMSVCFTGDLTWGMFPSNGDMMSVVDVEITFPAAAIRV